MRTLTILLLACSVWGQVSVGNRSTKGTDDNSGAQHTLPAVVYANVAALPGTCSAGEFAYVTAGIQVYVCGASNNWIQAGVLPQLGTVNTTASPYTITNCGYTVTLNKSSGIQSATLPSSGCYVRVQCSAGTKCALSGSHAILGAGAQLQPGQMGMYVSDGAYWYGTLVTSTGSGAVQVSTTFGYADAHSSDVVNLFTGCTGTQFLAADGNCYNPTTFYTYTSGPVTDPGGLYVFLNNNASGALTFNLPDGSAAGMQRCYRNSTGKSGAITVAVTTGNNIDVGGANGTTSTGTLVSGGALGDSACLVADGSSHWYAYIYSGLWSNN